MNNTGIFLLIGGWISLTSWGVFQGVLESDSPVLTISVAAVWLGILILLVRALIQRREESKTDPYKHVEK